MRELWMCLTSPSVARELRARKGRRSGSPFPLSFSIAVPLLKVSGLGLRVLADPKVLSVLQSPELHGRPIVLEGQLGVRAGVLRVHSARAA